MLNSFPKFILLILLSPIFSTLSYRDRQASSSELFGPSAYRLASFNGDNEVIFSPRSKQRFQQSPIGSLPKISEVPLLSVKLLNAIAILNNRTQICQGRTHELLLNRYFPKIYGLSSQEYLVEQLCDLGISNNRYSYFIYRAHRPISGDDMKSLPEIAYHQNQEGYFFISNGFNLNRSNRWVELQLFDGEIIPLTFEQYQPNKLSNPIGVKSYLISTSRSYNPSQKILSVFASGKRMTDCGSFTRYQLEEKRFKLLEYRYQKCCLMPQECRDPNYHFFPEDYPRVYPQ